jgi:uncharacterized membrane protein
MSTTSPLVQAYLADLDRALAGADPADRMEIVDSVREHIDASIGELGASPTQAQIAGVLRRLGTADDVASTWSVRAGDDGPEASSPAAAGRSAGGWPRWATVLVAVVVGLVVLFVALPLVGLVAWRSDTGVVVETAVPVAP